MAISVLYNAHTLCCNIAHQSNLQGFKLHTCHDVLFTIILYQAPPPPSQSPSTCLMKDIKAFYTKSRQTLIGHFDTFETMYRRGVVCMRPWPHQIEKGWHCIRLQIRAQSPNHRTVTGASCLSERDRPAANHCASLYTPAPGEKCKPSPFVSCAFGMLPHSSEKNWTFFFFWKRSSFHQEFQ